MPAPNERFADDIRDAVRAMMEADPYYADVPILTERLQDLDAKIDETIQLAGGIAIILVVVGLAEPLQNLPGANFAEIKLVARVIENLNLNATGKGAQEIAIHTAALWSQLKPDALTAPLRLEGVELGNDPRGLTFDCSGSTSGGTQIDIPKLAPPILDVDGGEVTMSHVNPGAFIFYTLNNSVPAPRNPLSAVYLGPFNPPAETPIRARAWLPGSLPSAESRVTIAALGTEQGEALVTESGATLIP